MIYLVLREPTATGYVNRFAYTDDPATTSVMCGGQSIAVTKGRITSIGEMGNRADISQAKGAVAQGVEWSFAIADWDGTGRTSAGIYAGQNRIYGWSVAVARHDTSTTPVWFNSEDHWCVTDLQIDGTSISVSVGERWALDGRLLAFGDNGAQVPLVVGGHDVWVATAPPSNPLPINAQQTLAIKHGVPSSATDVLDVKKYASHIYNLGPSTNGGGAASYVFSSDELSAAFYDAIISAERPFLCGKDSSIPINKTRVFNIVGVVSIYGEEDFSQWWFFQKETDASVVFCENRAGAFAIAGGASSLIGFGESIARIAGNEDASLGVLSIDPTNYTADGAKAYIRIPCKIGFLAGTEAGAVSFDGDAGWIVADGGAVGGWCALDADLRPLETPSGMMFYKDSIDATAGGITLNIAPELDATTFQEYVSTCIARLTTKFDDVLHDYGGTPQYSIPFGAQNQYWAEVRVPDVVHDHFFTEDFGQLKTAKTFPSIAALNAGGVWAGAVSSVGGQHTWMNFQLLAVNIYGVDRIKIGSSYALVKTGPSPIDASVLTTASTLDVAASLMLLRVADAGATTIETAPPTYTPASSDSGEAMDASKSCVQNAETIAQEIWAMFSVSRLGEADHSGQGIGEVPTAVALVLGRFEDIVTEPVIEYCNVAGTLTKKAYIANVDLEFDSINASKFYGGWGYEPLPDTIQQDFLYYRWDICPIQLGPMPASPDGSAGSWYYETLHGNTIWQSAVDYGYLIWRQCRAAYKTHRVKRGQTYQFNGIYDDSVIGRMWWEAKRNGSRRIEWLCLQPRYLTYSVREDRPLNWAGSSVYIAGSMANYAGYDVSTWDNAGGDQLVVVEKRYNLQTAIATYTVAIPPLATVDAVPVYRDTINAALDKLVDTVDATAVTPKYIDTLEP